MRLQSIYERHMSPVVPFSRVNNGYCYVWAWIAAAHIPSACLYSDTGDDRGADHAFIRIGKLFFDAEATHGTPDPLQLNLFKLWYTYKTRDCVERLNPYQFFRYWQQGADYFGDRLTQVLEANRDNKQFVETVQAYNLKHLGEWI